MSTLSIGLSGLLVNQQLLEMTGQNVANAGTSGFHRQVANLAQRVTSGGTGTGVEIQSISRVLNQTLEDAIVNNNSANKSAGTQLTNLQQLQAYLDPADGSLHDLLGQFFDQLHELGPQPDNLPLRQQVLATAGALADRLNTTYNQISTMRSGLVDQATQAVNQVNSLADDIARLNHQIQGVVAGGGQASGLLDLRDQAITKLSDLVDVRTVPQEFGQVNVFVAGTALVLNNSARHLAADINNKDQLVIHVATSQQPLEVSGGSLGGILALRNTILPAVAKQFDTLAQGLIKGLDGIHATSVGLDGSMTNVSSQRLVTNTNLPLGAAKLSFPPSAGDLYITVTNLATGQRTLNRVTFDPATQSLANLAGSISAVPNVQAVVDPQAGTLNILAAPDYGFDFSGSLSTVADSQAITGTTTPSFAGSYQGANNDALQFSFVGSGTIGATPNLTMEVRNGAGTLLKSFQVGQGYEAGTELPDVLGVKVKLTTGTVTNGDAFTLNVAANPDSAGLLPALGINTLFVGDSAGSLQVRPDLAGHPERLALSATGQPGDSAGLVRLLAQRDQLTMAGQTQTFDQFLNNLIGDVGTRVQDADVRQSALQSLGTDLGEQQQAVSGVDPNEELVRMVQFQRSYQMSARFISVVNQTYDDLFRMI